MLVPPELNVRCARAPLVHPGVHRVAELDNQGAAPFGRVVLEVEGAGAHAAYAAHFDFVRQTKTRKVNATGLQLQLQQLPTFSDELPEPN
ncbi:MAG: hypothetical protein ACRDOY_08055 [Nocardioidaceae bacterium]